MNKQMILKRFEAAFSSRTTVQQQWEVIEKYVAPYTGEFFRTNAGEHAIDWNTARDIYDATAVQSHIQLASSIHGSLTNPAIKWFEMQWRDADLQDDHAANVWLEAASKRVYEELLDSNFNLEANNAYKGLTSYATACLIEEPLSEPQESWRGVSFTHVPLKQVYFEPDDRGQAHIFFRLLQWRPSKIVAKFGLDKCPEVIQKAYERGDDTSPVDIVFCVFPREGASTDRIAPPLQRPWGWTYVLRKGASGAEPDVLDEGGYYEMPAVIPRWDITDESVWGNGPAHYALADVLTLNKLVQLDLKSREKVVDPAILYQERALLNNLNLGPGAQNPCRDPDKIRAFESAARFDAVESTIVRLQMSVQKYFYIDQLELKESPAMTATEVQVRYELMQRLLAAPMARLKEDMLDPIITRTFNMLLRAGELGEMPESVSNANTDYDINYIGPLSRSMKFDQSASIERWMTQLQLIAQSGGEAEKVLLVPDYDKIARDAARQLNLPTEYTRPAEDVEADMDNLRNQQNRAASAEAAQAEAAAAKDLGQAESLRAGEQNIAAV